MTKERLYDINDIESLVIDRQFVLIDKSIYTDDAYNEILHKIDNCGSIGFVINDKHNYKEKEFSYVSKIYAQGNYFSDFNSLQYFSKININDDSIIAPGPASNIKITGTGNTTVSALNNEIIINTDINKEYKELNDRISYVHNIVSNIESSYTSFTYIHDNYQEILYGGSYISIKDNIVSAYGLLSTNNFNDLISDYYTKEETNSYINDLKDFVLQGYYNKVAITSLLNNLKNDIIGDANKPFDTLEEISKWLIGSGNYTYISYYDLNDKDKYYIFNDNKYIDAKQPYYDNINYYKYEYKDAAYILSYIGYLIDDTDKIHNEIGKPDRWSYITSNGNEYIVDASYVTNYQDNYIDQYGNILTYSYASGIYKLINDAKKSSNEELDKFKSYVNETINVIKQDINNSLYNLKSDTTTSYAYLTFDKYSYDTPERTIIMNIVESDYNNENNTINKNGITTAYTVSDMLDYRLNWEII